MAEFSISAALRAIHTRQTEAERAKADELTQALRGRINPDSSEHRIARAADLEGQLANEMTWLSRQPESDLRTRRMNQMCDRIAELAAEQGDYKRAVAIAISPERRGHYRRILAAIRVKDEKTCACLDDRLVDRATGQEFGSGAVMTVDTIIDRSGVSRQLDVCRKCGFMNARW